MRIFLLQHLLPSGRIVKGDSNRMFYESRDAGVELDQFFVTTLTGHTIAVGGSHPVTAVDQHIAPGEETDVVIDLGLIAEAIRLNHIRITDHADEEAVADRISIEQALKGIAASEIIEQYPNDKPYPSCLIYSESDGPLHSVWAYNEVSSWAVLITVYRPDPQRWIDWRVRKPKS